ncbi:MAG: hypothetical protein NXI24_02405 [bacterium]|nr:hypothetical protein [bacterium]
MLHPFFDDPEPAQTADASPNLDFAGDITSADIKDSRVFQKPIDGVLRPHWSTVEIIRDRLLSDTLPPDVSTAVGQFTDKLEESLEHLQKGFQIYVETSAEQSLLKEASRLERRYFEQTNQPRQIQFLKLKRMYEKIRTFNERAKNTWREIQKVLDTLSVIKITQNIAIEIEKEYYRPLTLLMRQTEHFLDEVRTYLKIQEEIVDPITGSHKITVAFDDALQYTVAEVLGELASEGDGDALAEDSGPRIEEVLDRPAQELGGSVALNIVIETREHKLNRSSMIAVPLLGSRDWNRSPAYSMEVPIKYFEECILQLKSAYHVNVDEDDLLHTPMSTAAAVVRKGQGEHAIVAYHDLITENLDDTAVKILLDDFPGVEKPDVFLYHCGPNVFYRVLINELRAHGLGAMFFLDEANNSVREYPEEFLKKILIDWWNNRFAHLSGEDVDSYLTYSRQVEMVKREYRILYEEGVTLRKREQPGVSYLGVEKWLKENKRRVFGPRKMEIFRRYVSGTVIE